ncbi:MAG: hypothetical protein MK187_04950 [Acidimicrobiales bacterium]|nr:hypothetical protein [Acidimicrobiales bacterium]
MTSSVPSSTTTSALGAAMRFDRPRPTPGSTSASASGQASPVVVTPVARPPTASRLTTSPT